MLKYCDVAVTFTEFPDEIALCVNISNCPCNCPECSEPWLRDDAGEPLTFDAIDALIAEHPGCSTFGIMGGDCNHEDVARVAIYVHENHDMKVGFYSGYNYVDCHLLPLLDFYKIGSWIAPRGDQRDWWKTACGPLSFPFSNQVYFEIKKGKLIDATHKFRRHPIGDLTRHIVTS